MGLFEPIRSIRSSTQPKDINGRRPDEETHYSGRLVLHRLDL